MSDTDGGAAFPCERMHTELHNDKWRDRWIPEGGMSLRDYFAAQALPTAIEHELALRAEQIKPGMFRYDEVASSAYAVADAMLKERQK